uniref:Gypsy retrotransposon integrase-like protein 1 n=1 Tax=Astyanax mexicanus TaxID=7994 RepID=A0A3B1JFH0_ASTMX
MKVLNRLKDFGLKLSPDKCHFFKSSVKYLGHVVDADGVHTDPEKISALKSWPRPSTRKQLKCFLGFAGYYRRFIDGYSRIVKPLNHLTSGYWPPRKRGKMYKRERIQSPVNADSPFQDEWSPECEAAFKTIIERLTSAPVLAFANPKLSYILHTDASQSGLGAALYQEQEGKLRVIAYASRGLSKSEQNYPAHKLEYLALKWAVCEKFSDYLYGSDFTVLTDNNPLTYVLTSAKLDAAGHRWLAALSAYRFNIKYRAGSTNKDADGLSRRPHHLPHEDKAFLQEKERIENFKRHILNRPQEEIQNTVFSALCELHSVGSTSSEFCGGSEFPVLAECLAVDASSIPHSFVYSGQETIPGMSHKDWYRAQREDPSIKEIINCLGNGQRPNMSSVGHGFPEVRLLMREWNKLELRDGVLYTKRMDDGEINYQLVLPPQYRETALRGVHDDIGHLGLDRALHLARARF